MRGWLFIATTRMLISMDEAVNMSPAYLDQLFDSYLLAQLCGQPIREIKHEKSIDEVIPL